MSDKKVVLLGCGGAGINLAKRFINRGQEGFATLDVRLVDTSKSNLPKDVDPGKMYIFEDMDGNGKLRSSENYTTINERTREILQHVQPSNDIVIVLHSASGGSGSVIGPLLVGEMLKKGTIVIVGLVGSTDSRIEAQNTVNTLKSYENIANKTERPIAVMYDENTHDKSRAQVDRDMESNIVLLSLFFSGSNKELDMSDLRNFLDYQRVTSFKPRLTGLTFSATDPKFERDHIPISAVSLTNNDLSASIHTPIEYQAVGFLPSDLETKMEIKLPLHMVTVGNYFGGVIDRLQRKLKEIDEHRSAIVEKSILSNDDRPTDGMLIL